MGVVGILGRVGCRESARATLRRAAWSGAAMWLVAGLVASAPLPAAAQDIVAAAKASLADLPAWKIPDICAKDSAQSHCLQLESRAWRTVGGSWVAIPDAVKKLCLGAARAPSDYSWRVLNDCIDEAMEKNVDKKAVATRYTPAEPVPPARRAAPPTPPAPVQAAAAAPPKPEALPPLTPLTPLVVAPPPAPPPPPQTPANVAVPPPILGLSPAPPPFALAAEAEAKRKAEADAAEARRRADAEAEAKRRAEADAAAQRAAAEAEARRKAEAEAAAKAAAAAAAQKCQDDFQAIARDGIIRFRIASATLDAQSQPTITRLAAAMKACPGVAVLVEGHTDAVGQDDANLQLSRERAQSVVDQLVRAGIDAAALRAEGFGKTRPVGDNATPEGRALNRRIEFKAAPR